MDACWRERACRLCAGCGSVREIPFELGLGYRVALGQYLSLGVRGEAIVMSRRMAIANADPRHRWLGALRGGVEGRLNLNEDFGLTLLVGAEGRLGRTEVNVAGTGSAVFSPVAPYLELGPSLSFRRAKRLAFRKRGPQVGPRDEA